jgi:hypothetical protein
MVEPPKDRQTKGAAMAMFYLMPHLDSTQSGPPRRLHEFRCSGQSGIEHGVLELAKALAFVVSPTLRAEEMIEREERLPNHAVRLATKHG